MVVDDLDNPLPMVLVISRDRLRILLGLDYKPELLSIFLPRRNGLGALGSQTLSAIIGDSAINNGAAVQAFPGIEHEKEIRESLQHHHPLTLWTIH
jgi:hypothetical protein